MDTPEKNDKREAAAGAIKGLLRTVPVAGKLEESGALDRAIERAKAGKAAEHAKH